MFGLKTTEILLIVLVILLLFGGKKIPELMKGMGRGVKSFKEGMSEEIKEEKKEDKEEIQKEESKFDNIKESLIKANVKLDTVCNTTTETRSDIKAMNKDLISIDRRVTGLERDMKTVFNAIDELKGYRMTQIKFYETIDDSLLKCADLIGISCNAEYQI